MVHRNAPLTETGRLRLARCIVDRGWPVSTAAERFQVARTTAKKWSDRYRQLGPAGMADRSSRPHRSPRRTPQPIVRKIVHLRWKQRLGPRAKVGDRYVLEVMQEKGWLFGGEGSGHLLALDKHTTGDGIVSALQVLSALKRSGKGLDECCSELTLYPQSLINVKVSPGFDWTKNAAMVSEKEKAEKELGDAGRVLIRASGTEPLIRVMVEAKTQELAETMARRIADKVTVA